MLVIHMVCVRACLLALCRYLMKLVDYLSGYLDRLRPLLDQAQVKLEAKQSFVERWNQGNFPGWRVSGGT